MKRVTIFFSSGVFFFLIARYIFENLSPFKLDLLQEQVVLNNIQPQDWDAFNKLIADLIYNKQILNYLSYNAYFGSILFLIGLFCFFTSIHLVVDKIFFKDFFVKASLFDAVRRSLIFTFAIFISIYSNLYGLSTEIIVLINILLILSEIIFAYYFKQNLKSGLHKVNKLAQRINQQELPKRI